MEIKNYNQLTDFDVINTKYIQLKSASQTKNSETIHFLKELYTYPPRFRITWRQLDDLNQDKTSGTLFQTGYSNNNVSSGFKKKGYSLQKYINSYVNKSESSNFYKKKATNLTNLLQTVPVYVVVNGRGHIVTANSNLQSKYHSDFLPTQNDNKIKNLGLIFCQKLDAELYLKEIVKTDVQGTNEFGLTIECIGLNSAYELLRGDHSNIDFRFIPDFNEIQNVLEIAAKHDDRFVFDTEQQQHRQRFRTYNIPVLNSVSDISTIEQAISPLKSFIQIDEYFKGVPIYVVQIRNSPQNIFLKKFSGLFYSFEKAYERHTKDLFTITGYGQDWLSQSNENRYSQSEDVINVVCFEKARALEFLETYRSRVVHHAGRRIPTRFIENLSRQPRIYVHNLEDFLEIWDESILSTLTHKDIKTKLTNRLDSTSNVVFNTQQETHFIPSQDSEQVLNEFLNRPKTFRESFTGSSGTSIRDFYYLKFRKITGFFSVLFKNY